VILEVFSEKKKVKIAKFIDLVSLCSQKIERCLHICTLFLVYSQIWPNLPRWLPLWLWMRNPKKKIHWHWPWWKREKKIVHFGNSGNWIELTAYHFFPYGWHWCQYDIAMNEIKLYIWNPCKFWMTIWMNLITWIKMDHRVEPCHLDEIDNMIDIKWYGWNCYT
jgi:hypothetical protein